MNANERRLTEIGFGSTLAQHGQSEEPAYCMAEESKMIPFETENGRAYVLILRIEVALRECLRIALESEHGKQWRKRIPGDLLRKIKESQAEENRPQFDFVRLGPLYYLTFGELLTLLQQKSGRSVSDMLGGDCFVKQLENIFAPRNAICHSRPVSSVGLRTIETLYAEMETALTPGRLAKLVSHPDIGLTPIEAAKVMIPALEQVMCELPKLPTSFVVPEGFRDATVQFWWAEDEFAGFNRLIVESAFGCIEEYNKLPPGVGCAGIRQRYCEQQQLKHQVQNAIAELEKATA